MMKLTIDESFFVSDIKPDDKPAYLEHLREKQIYDQTEKIPFPYTDADADWWINHVAETTKVQGRSVNWAIRRTDGYLIGGIDFHNFQLGKSHKSELGYWLAKPFWGRGIMTEAVKKVTEFGFSEFGLVRITANVFHFNAGSARVLEKAGYRLEGNLRNHYKKDGTIFDGKLYAKLAPNLTPKDKKREEISVKSTLLVEEEIHSRLGFLPEWRLTPKGEISRTFEFKSFARALLFVNSAGYLAEQMDHHPDIDIRWNRVTLTLATHSAKGLTQLDFSLAERVEGICLA